MRPEAEHGLPGRQTAEAKASWWGSRPRPFTAQVGGLGVSPAEALGAGPRQDSAPGGAASGRRMGLGLLPCPPRCPAPGLTFPYTSTSKRMPKAFRSVRYSLPFSIL